MSATTNEKKKKQTYLNMIRGQIENNISKKHHQNNHEEPFFFRFHNLKLNSKLFIIIKNGIEVSKPH
jgi:hypothetical protein